MSSKFSSVLLDLDGTVYQDNGLCPGARSALDFLRSSKISYRFLTNTTTRSRRAICEKLAGFGIGTELSEIVTPAMCLTSFLQKRGFDKSVRIMPLVREELLEDLAEFRLVRDDTASIVLMGDMVGGYSQDDLSRALSALTAGADIVALHQNRMNVVEGKPLVDVGGYVAALEYASGKQSAGMLGKPSANFFEAALNSLNATPDQTVMIGDDLLTDVLAAQEIGINGALVKTGKHERAPWKGRASEANFVWENVGNLVDLF